MRLSIATKVFLGFVAVLVCSAAVSGYGIVRLQRIGRGLSLLARPYMPLTRAISTLEAFQKERERSTDRLLEEADPRTRANLISLDRTYFARVVGERLTFAQQLVESAQQTTAERDPLDRIAARLSTVAVRIADEEKAAAVVTAQQAPSEDAIARLKTAERRGGWRGASGNGAPRARLCCGPSGWRPSAGSRPRSRTRSATLFRVSPSMPRSWASVLRPRATCATRSCARSIG